MATPVADPLTAVDPQADLGFAAGVTLTQSGSRVQNADGSEVWTYTLANYSTPADAEIIRLQNATIFYAAPVVKVAPEKVVCALGSTQLTLTSYLGDVPSGTPNITASFTEDEVADQIKKHLTVMRDTYMVGGGDPELVERSGQVFDFRISGVDKNTLDQVVLDTIMDYTVQETATALSLTPESITANTLSPPKEAGASLTLPSLPDIDLRLNSGPVTIPVDNPMIGDTRPIMTVGVQFPGVCSVEVLPSMLGIIVTPLNEGTVQISVDLEMIVVGPGGLMDVDQVRSSFSTAVNNDGLPVATLNGDATPEVEFNGTYTEAGYTNPNPTGDQTINTTGSVDTSVAGDYTLTYAFTNGFGTTTLTRVVTVLPEPPDTTAPVITILGDNPQFVELGSPYVDPNPPATSDGGEDVYVSGLVSPTTLGDYILTYTATDAAGNVGTATRTVTVRDTVSPVITLNGASTINLTQGDTYTEAGATATDNSGEAMSVVIDSTAVDTSAVGTYTVNYSATDSSGNTGTATRSVVVASADPSNQSIAVTVDGGVFQFSPTLTELNYGYTYTFDQSDATNSNHPLRFSTVSDGTHGDGVEISYRLTYATSGDATSDQATINGIDLTTYGSSSLNPTATAITRARVTGTLIFVKQTMSGYSTGSFGSAQRTEAISVMNGIGTNLSQVEILEVMGGVARTHGITIGADNVVYEVPNTTPTTMHYYCANHSGMGNSLTVGYPSTTPIPSAYTIHWTDPEELFPSVIDMDTVNQGIVRIQNIFDQTSSRRPGAESLVYDTHMEFVGDQTINSAATGGPTNFPQTLNLDLEMWDITGWVEEGRVTWKTLGSMDGLLAFSGRPRNTTELTTAHEILHALGVGSLSTGTYAINGQQNVVRTYAAGQPALWLGQNAISLYTTIYANAITDGDVTATPDGVPLKYNDMSHFNDDSAERRGVPFIANNKNYIGMWNEIVTATGGDYITFSGAMLKDFGLPVVVNQLEPMPAPTIPKTYDFDVTVVGGEFRLAPSTTANVGNVYSRAWNNTEVTGVDNANIHIQWNDVVVIHTGALGTTERMNVYSPDGYNTGSPWETLTSVEAWSGGDQSIVIAPGALQAAEDERAAAVPEDPDSVESTGDWMNYFVRYSNTADNTKHGFIKVSQQGKEMVGGGDGDWDNDGIKNINDNHHPDFLNSIVTFTAGAPQSSGLLFQAGDTNYFANTVGSQDYPLNVSTTADEPWALSTSFVYRRRKHAFLTNSDSGVVLFSFSHPSATSNIHTTGSNPMLQLSMHENQYTGSIFARFTVGTQTDNVVITSGDLNYNYLYNGVYVDYDGAGTYRMYTYDYSTQTLTLIPGSGVVSTGSWNGVHSSEHLVVGKNLGEDVYWHGRLSHLSMTTLSHDVALPDTTEVEKFIKNPFEWSEDYRQGEQFRMPGDTSNLAITTTTTNNTPEAAKEIYISNSLMYIDGTFTIDASGSVDNTYNIEYSKQYVFDYNTGVSGLTTDYGDLRLTTVSPEADLAGAQDPANIITDGVTYTSNSQIVLSANTVTHPIPSTVYIVDLTSAASYNTGEPDYQFVAAVRDAREYRGVLNITTGTGDFGAPVTTTEVKTFDAADGFTQEVNITTDQVNSATATKVWHFGRTLVNGVFLTAEENLVAYNKSEHDLVKN